MNSSKLINFIHFALLIIDALITRHDCSPTFINQKYFSQSWDFFECKINRVCLFSGNSGEFICFVPTFKVLIKSEILRIGFAVKSCFLRHFFVKHFVEMITSDRMILDQYQWLIMNYCFLFYLINSSCSCGLKLNLFLIPKTPQFRQNTKHLLNFAVKSCFLWHFCEIVKVFREIDMSHRIRCSESEIEEN